MAGFEPPRRWPLALGVVLGGAALLLGWSLGRDVADSWLLASRYTARVGLPMLLVVFCAGAMAQLLPGRVTRALLRDQRWWLLGFVATQTVHLYAFVRYAPFATIPTPRDGYFVYALLYAVAITANDRAQRAMGRVWPWLQEIGIDVVWLVYTAVYVAKSTIPDTRMSALPLAVISLAALVVRVAAWVARRRA